MSDLQESQSTSGTRPSPELLVPHPEPPIRSISSPRALSPSAHNSASNSSSPPAVVLASAGYDHTIRFWDVIQGQCIGTLQHNESQVNCLALSPDKLLLAAGGHPAIRLYETMAALRTSPNQQLATGIANNPPWRILEGHKKNVVALGFMAGGRLLWSAGEEGQVRLWDLRTDHKDNIIAKHNDNIAKDTTLAPKKNNKKSTDDATTPASAGASREWDLCCSITCAALHPNQEDLLVGDEHGRIRLVRLMDPPQSNLGSKSPWILVETKLSSRNVIRDVAISTDGQLIAAIDHDGGLHGWCLIAASPSIVNSDISLSLDINGSPDISNPATIAITDDDDHSGATLTAPSVSASISASTLPTYINLTLLTSLEKAHSRYGLKCMFSPDPAHSDIGTNPVTHLLTTSADGMAKLWQWPECRGEGEPPKLIQQFNGHTKWVWDCAFSADSAYILTASSDETLRLWDVRTAETVAIYTGHSKAVTCVALNDFPII